MATRRSSLFGSWAGRPARQTRSTENYLNTGTFLRRNGEWRAVAWQATREPEPRATAAPAKDAPVNLTPGAVARPGLAAEIQAADAAFFKAFFDTCDIADGAPLPDG